MKRLAIKTRPIADGVDELFDIFKREEETTAPTMAITMAAAMNANTKEKDKLD